ncbi:MAG: LysM peptidoglycan-binding domain-containing protein [Deltaproteobacteria bacterium]
MSVTRIKIKNINRFRVFCFLIFFFAVIFMQNKFLYSYNYPKTQCIIIQGGDSLWSIAQKYKAKNDDTRDFIERVKEINSLDNSELTQGQEIKVPVIDS